MAFVASGTATSCKWALQSPFSSLFWILLYKTKRVPTLVAMNASGMTRAI